ncbi:hypothetical protein THRCLA_21379 [Thraustotheca clavata]|uniref:Uncharacterized protein n=1 Tax=Thraustotheca clavata TaxID=74557 RepID=A0A1V9ZX36_9STRA|nr:hypothetical protein THRCLA_21379 [Thraustotheca clavata]
MLSMDERSPQRWKRHLSEETLERNRQRSKLYYAANRAKVLAKLKSNYAEKRQRQVQEQCEKYRDFLTNYFTLDPIVSVPVTKVEEDNEETPNPLRLSYILN